MQQFILDLIIDLLLCYFPELQICFFRDYLSKVSNKVVRHIRL